MPPYVLCGQEFDEQPETTKVNIYGLDRQAHNCTLCYPKGKLQGKLHSARSKYGARCATGPFPWCQACPIGDLSTRTPSVARISPGNRLDAAGAIARPNR